MAENLPLEQPAEKTVRLTALVDVHLPGGAHHKKGALFEVTETTAAALVNHKAAARK